MKTPTLTILRGTPGCGKSSYALERFDPKNICSTDTFFVDKSTGEYVFEPSKIGENHSLCFSRFLTLANNGYDICLDNTNIHLWELRNYAWVARNMGYKVVITSFYPQNMDFSILLNRSKRNLHGVSTEKCLTMFANMLDQDKRIEDWAEYNDVTINKVIYNV